MKDTEVNMDDHNLPKELDSMYLHNKTPVPLEDTPALKDYSYLEGGFSS